MNLHCCFCTTDVLLLLLLFLLVWASSLTGYSTFFIFLFKKNKSQIKLTQPPEGASDIFLERKKLLKVTEKLMKIITIGKLSSKKQQFCLKTKFYFSVRFCKKM